MSALGWKADVSEGTSCGVTLGVVVTRQLKLGDPGPYPLNVLGCRLARKLALFLLVEMAGRTGFKFAKEDAKAGKLFRSFLGRHAAFMLCLQKGVFEQPVSR